MFEHEHCIYYVLFLPSSKLPNSIFLMVLRILIVIWVEQMYVDFQIGLVII